MFGIIGGLGFSTNFNQAETGETGRLISVLKTPKPTPPIALTGAVAVPSPTPKATPKPKASATPDEFIMGDMEMPTPTPNATPKNAEVLMGKVKVSRD